MVYKKIHWKEILAAFKGAVLFSSTVMALFSIVGIFSWLIAAEGVSAKLSAAVIAMHLSPWLFLLIVNVFFLFLGMIMDAIPAMTIFVPVLLPIATSLGIDPIHFGCVIVVNLMLGLITPPVGGLLFVESKLAKVSFDRLSKAVVPFILSLLVILMLITYLPALVTWLPNLIFS